MTQRTVSINSSSFQSTHPHGVRQRGFCKGIIFDLFQSTHPHGVRQQFNADYFAKVLFQSTHPHGVRPRHKQLERCILSFNPRTHTGCDLKPERFRIEFKVSIHAPTRGATQRFVFLSVPYLVSIHAPTRGATKFNHLVNGGIAVSIHAPTRGATLVPR